MSDITNNIIGKYIPNHSSMDHESYNFALLDLDVQSVYEMQSELLKVQGSGEDFVWLNESTRGGNLFTDYHDVLSYDVPWAAYQNDHTNISLSDALLKAPVLHKVSPDGYRNRLSGDRLRLMYQGKMHYCELYCADHYIVSLVDQKVDKWLDGKYPFDVFIRTFNSGNVIGSGESVFETTHSLNAEAYARCRTIFADWYSEIKEDLNTDMRRMTPATYLTQEIDDEGLPILTLVCRNEGTMSLIRTNFFISDFLKLRTNSDELTMIAERYFKDVMSRFNDAGF